MNGGGGARVTISGITSSVKNMIQDIREIAGEHSDDDIYAMLKECSMDPNETAQKLLHLDTFHEVKKKHGRQKENVIIKPSDIPGKQRGARFGKGAKLGGANFHSQNTPQVHASRSFGGSKENGFPNMSKGQKYENKTAAESSRRVHVKVNGKSIEDEDPQAIADSAITSSTGHAPLTEVVKSDETCVPADGGKPLELKSEIKLLAPVSSETVHVVAISPGSSVRENQYAMSNGEAGWCSGKIEKTVPRAEIVDTAKSQATVINSNDQACQARVNKPVDFAEKQPISEDDISVLNEDASKLGVSDGHVVFPEHLHVPEAYKKKITFGSFGDSWQLNGNPTIDGDYVSTDVLMPVDDSYLVKTVDKSSVESGGIILSTVQDAQERENYLGSSLPMTKNNPYPFERAPSDVAIKVEEPETESLLCNGGPDIAYHPSNNVFGYAPKSQLQAHDRTELKGGNLITSSTSTLDQNGSVQPSGVAHGTDPSPPDPFLRQTYHPYFFPHGHYYPQFIVPQLQQQYFMHGGFPQQYLVPNQYLSSAAAGGVKYSHPQQKQQGQNAETDGYIGASSGYSPYVPFTFPYGPPPPVMPGNVAVDDDQATHLKENIAITTEQQRESLGEWMAGTGRTVSGMQINPLYNLSPGQGRPMVFPPTSTGFAPFGGVYHPSVQTFSAPPQTIHPHIQQHNSMGSAEPPPTVFYHQQQPSQGSHILHNSMV